MGVESVRSLRTPEHHRWTHITLPPKGTWKGWTAGPAFGCEGHQSGSFKPCRALVTDGAMACPYCAMPLPLRFTGFLPLYDATTKKVVLSINLDLCDLTDAMPPLTPISLKKGPFKNAPIELVPGEWTTMRPTGRHVLRTAQDVRSWFFNVLCKKEGLAEVFNGRAKAGNGASDTPMSTGMVPHPDRAIAANRPAVVTDVALLKGVLTGKKKMPLIDHAAEVQSSDTAVSLPPAKKKRKGK